MTAITVPRLDAALEPSLVARVFRRDAHAPQAARNFVVSVLADHGIDADTAEVARLLVSELVTNASQYSNRGHITVTVELDDKRARLTVTDAGRTRASLPAAAPDDDSEHGRGWLLIEALAADSGIERIAGGNGHRAWFELLVGGAP